MMRVAVIGAAGRMGRMVCRAVADDPDMRLVAGVNPSLGGEPLGPLIDRPDVDVQITDTLDTLLQAETEVAVDFTRPDVVMEDVKWAIDHAVHIVVGTSGIGASDLDAIRKQLDDEANESNVVVVPNFAIGAVLMQRFAAEAVRYFPAAEIIELHHDGKLDAPSGTAIATAARLAEARGDAPPGPGAAGETIAGVRGGEAEGVRVHSVRLPGFVAHQEVILGGLGQTLTIRHDSTDRASFIPGVLLAIKEVVRRRGLTVGLEPLLDLPPLAPPPAGGASVPES
jgi:4-hydroxy-tetrahydrodipicolinate reductase